MTLSVLIVDDSLTVRMDLRERFEQAGHRATPVAHLAGARAALSAQRFDLLILDVQLPDGDGVEFLTELRSLPGGDLPVILLSDRAAVSDRIRGMRLGADDYAGKPYDGETLVERAQVMVRQRGDGGGDRRAVIVMGPTGERSGIFGALADRLVDDATRVVEEPRADRLLRTAAREQATLVIVAAGHQGLDPVALVRRLRVAPRLRNAACLLLSDGEDATVERDAVVAGADVAIRVERGVPLIAEHARRLLRSASAATGGTAATTDMRRVLAVDDSETFLQHISASLRECGYEAVLARSGEEAVALLAVQRVDCVLLDSRMPGWSGEDTVRRLRAQESLATLPVLMLSADDDEEAMLRGIRAGADDYITKQSGFEVVRARIDAHLRRKVLDDENRRLENQRLRAELDAREAEAKREREVAEARAEMTRRLRRANRQLERSNRRIEQHRSALRQFAWLTSHDMRTPLREASMFGQLLTRRCRESLGPEGREFLAHVTDAVERMGMLIDGLADYLEDEEHGAPEPVPLALDHCVDRVLAAYAEQLESVGAVVERSELPRALAGPAQVEAVISHLTDNAIRFRGDAPLRVSIDGRCEGREVCVTFTDNGLGFAPDHSERIFELFGRLHAARSGVGVGLSRCRRIVQQLGGRIWCDSAPGRGARFSFTLPAPSATSGAEDDALVTGAAPSLRR